MDQQLTPPASPPLVLSFAASDPTSGAGIQADLLAIAANGCHPLTVLTAITVQDSVGVSAVLPLDAEWVERQARALLADFRVAAFKIGVTGSVANIAAIAAILADYPDIPVVLDPVLASGRGDAFSQEDIAGALRELLLPRVTLLTPNSLEARRLAGVAAADGVDLAACAARLIDQGCRTVLVTGTHEQTEQVENVLWSSAGILRSDCWPRLPGEYHGSGCTLASAIAAALARGLPLADAVYAGEEYTWQTLAAAFSPGRGQSIPDRFFARGASCGEPRRPALRGLYAITPDGLPEATLLAKAEAALAGGAAVLQLRDKSDDAARRLRLAQALAALCRRFAARFIVNDDLPLALAVGADGLHLGVDDGDLLAARRALPPGAILGASCYADIDLARRAVAAGADYVAFGAVHPSSTKPLAVRAPLSLLGRARAELGVPVCAIGGITLANAAEIVAAGADLIAVVSDLFDPPGVDTGSVPSAASAIGERAAAFQRLFKENRE